MRDVPSADLYAHVAFVFQDPGLLRASVRDNIRLARPDAGDGAVEAAARAAQIHARVLELPRGYDSVVGEDARLSGGEAQRVAIARALLADRPILVLDEATAFADPESEAAIQDALSRLAAGRTLVVIAHRLSTIAGADRILVLSGGRVVERGRHAELLAAGGEYARLWAAHERASGMIRTLHALLDPGRPPAAARAGRRASPPTPSLQGIAFVLLVPILDALLEEEPAGGWLALLAAVVGLAGVAFMAQAMLAHRLGTAVARTIHRRLGDHLAALPLGWFGARTRRRAGPAGEPGRDRRHGRRRAPAAPDGRRDAHAADRRRRDVPRRLAPGARDDADDPAHLRRAPAGERAGAARGGRGAAARRPRRAGGSSSSRARSRSCAPTAARARATASSTTRCSPSTPRAGASCGR